MWLHSQDYCQPAVMHEVAVSGSCIVCMYSVKCHNSIRLNLFSLRMYCGCPVNCVTPAIVFPSSSYTCVEMVICCVPVPIFHCRADEMPSSCVPWAAILLLLSTLPPKWRATSLTLMMTDIQPCTGRPKTISCPWWSTS